MPIRIWRKFKKKIRKIQHIQQIPFFAFLESLRFQVWLSLRLQGNVFVTKTVRLHSLYNF
jgi:hypothetical protein